MKLKTTGRLLPLVALLAVCLVALLQLVKGAATPPLPAGSNATGLAEPEGNRDEPEYWLRRRDWFYRRTRFPLPDFSLKLLGLRRTVFENKSAQPVGHLPFWFDYELFKRVFNKNKADEPGRQAATTTTTTTTTSAQEERERHQAYVSTCLRTLKARVLFRMLAGTSDTLITEDADKFYWEKFGPLSLQDADERAEISMLASFKVEPRSGDEESPLDRAIRLVSEEMKIVESKNQVETNLRAFNEVDGSAIAGKLPY